MLHLYTMCTLNECCYCSNCSRFGYKYIYNNWSFTQITLISWEKKTKSNILVSIDSFNLSLTRDMCQTSFNNLVVQECEDSKQEEITENELILDQLWTFRSVQQRMILHDSLLTRQADSVPSLQSLSWDAVLLILSTNNNQERLVTPLVDRLDGEITTRAREILLTSYQERK